jgi:hypothetical protein
MSLYFYPKFVSKLSKICGWDPGSANKLIPDPGSGSSVKKTPDPGSESAALVVGDP